MTQVDRVGWPAAQVAHDRPLEVLVDGRWCPGHLIAVSRHDGRTEWHVSYLTPDGDPRTATATSRQVRSPR